MAFGLDLTAEQVAAIVVAVEAVGLAAVTVLARRAQPEMEGRLTDG